LILELRLIFGAGRSDCFVCLVMFNPETFVALGG
jgi:hypothetical protein